MAHERFHGMSLESDLASWFASHNWTWKLKTGKKIPDEVDVLDVLDAAAKDLYNEPVGAELHVGRLIIKKLHQGFDVYAYFGQYD
jgi:hypothetical protein